MQIDQIEGLSLSEIAKRQKKFGFNELPDKNKKNIFKTIFFLLTEPMIFLLLATVGIYFFLGDSKEALLLLASFLGIIGIELYQDMKTEKSLEALRNLSSPICDVIRDGKRITIAGREVTVGDIILLSEGSRVPADAKLVSAENLRVDESLLTGESESVEKHIRDISDFRINSVFSGTLVVKGHGIAEVTGIGSNTEIGKIGTSLNSIETEKTLLQKEVNKVVKLVAILAIGLSTLLAIFYWIGSGDLTKGLLAGLTLAISILPEEFPVVLAIFLTLGSWRLAKNNVLARKAHTIETLGSATILCVDKTGTLTENKMKINCVVNVDGSNYNGDFSDVSEIIKYGVLASQKNPFDPMEEAFIEEGKKIFSDINNIYDNQNIIKEYPLEDDSLAIVYVWGKDNDVCRIALKGAPEAVFDLCHLDKKVSNKIEDKVKELASHGLRVLAVAKGLKYSSIPNMKHDLEFEFLGLVGLADPIRREVPAAIKMCKDAGIKVVMITGDYPQTAMNIASKIGLDSQGIITGAEFEKLSEKERTEIIKSVSVFSRVSPANKLTIVNAFKANGEVVAMTGDGVNDAPALKSAHVGIAMGKRGTDVAREAATIVLLDDNFASIVNGVKLGRKIYDNLQKAMSYIISVHVPIAFLALIPVILKWPLVLMPAHIVFLEFVIDPSCTIVFENEKENKNIMSRMPRKLRDPIFNKRMVLGSLAQGLFVAGIVVAAFKILSDMGWVPDKARSMTFLILVVTNIVLILGISGKQALANIFRLENKAMIVVLGVTAIFLSLVLNVPLLRELFHFEQLTLLESGIGVLIGIVSIIGILPLRSLINRIK